MPDSARPLRILHIGKFFPPDRGGMETYLADLIEQQRSGGMDARALVHGQPRADDPHWLQRLPVQVRLIFTPISLGFPLAIRRSIKTFQPDVLHLHMPNVAVFWLLLLGRRTRRVPWVVHWHSDVTFSADQRALALAYRLYRPLEHRILAQARFVIATSPPYLQASETLRPWRDKCFAIPLGLQSQVQPQAQSDRQDGDHITQTWSAQRLRVVSVGRLTYYKGFETLIRAVAGMAQVQLRIVGEGDLRDDLQALIDELKAQGHDADVQLLGSVGEAEKHALLASCDVFALASRERTEAFGLALVEAMQFGKPCVVSDLPGSGMPWLIRQSGAGLCVPMDELGAWQRALEQLRTNPHWRQRLGQAGRQAAQQLFSIGANSQHVHSLYSSLVPEMHHRSPHGHPDRQSLAIVLPLTQLPESGPDGDARLIAWLDRLAAQCSTLAIERGGFTHASLVCIHLASNEPGQRDLRQRLNQWAQQWRHPHAPQDWRALFIQLPQGRHAQNHSGGLEALQTGIRWALRHGHQSLLYIPSPWSEEADEGAGHWPALTQAIDRLLQHAAQGAGDGAPDAGANTGAAIEPDIEVWHATGRAAKTGLGAALTSNFASSLQLYQRSAMQKVHHMRLSLLDQPETALMLMARQARLHLRTLELPELAPLTPTRKTPWQWRFALNAALMYLIKRKAGDGIGRY